MRKSLIFPRPSLRQSFRKSMSRPQNSLPAFKSRASTALLASGNDLEDLREEEPEEGLTKEVRIAVRVRNQKEKRTVVNVQDNGTKISIRSARRSVFGATESSNDSYTVHRAFDQTEDQKEVFSGIGEGPAEDALRGYKALVAAIGNTGTGKTHTLYGPSELFEDKGQFHEDDVGLVFRTFDYILDKLEKKEIRHFEIRMAVFELYSEGKSVMVRDLLNISNRSLSKRADEFGKELDWKTCSHRQEAAKHISQAFTHRKVSSHNLNAHSSRSFLFMPMRVLQWESDTNILEGEIMFVDFAGWEQSKQTGAVGSVLDEATFINSQLLAWSQCLDALAAQKNHVPYGDATLTRILRPYLQEALVTLILTITPDYSRCEDTRKILQKIKKLSRIITKSKRNSRRATFEERFQRKSSLEVQTLELENFYLKVDQEKTEKHIEDLKNKVEQLTSLLNKGGATIPKEIRVAKQKSTRETVGEPGRTESPKSESWVDLEFSQSGSDLAEVGVEAADAANKTPKEEPFNRELVVKAVEEKLDERMRVELEKVDKLSAKSIAEIGLRLDTIENEISVSNRLENLEQKMSISEQLQLMDKRLDLIENKQNPPAPPPQSHQMCCILM